MITKLEEQINIMNKSFIIDKNIVYNYEPLNDYDNHQLIMVVRDEILNLEASIENALDEEETCIGIDNSILIEMYNSIVQYRLLFEDYSSHD